MGCYTGNCFRNLQMRIANAMFVDNERARNSTVRKSSFTWVSKVIRVWFGFVLLRLVIGLKNSRHFLIQSDVKPKPIVTRSRTFARATRQLHICFEFWLNYEFVCALCDWPVSFLWFGYISSLLHLTYQK